MNYTNKNISLKYNCFVVIDSINIANIFYYSLDYMLKKFSLHDFL